MNVVWSYENRNSAFNKAELASARASVLLWKNLYPNHTTHLVCDDVSRQYFDTGNYDKIVSLSKNNIDKKVFWAACKIQALHQIKAPVCHIDLDFFTWTRFEDFGLFEQRMAASFKEDTLHYYLNPKIASKGANLSIDFTNLAYNTSFMYFADEQIKNEYCNIVLDYMKSVEYDMSIFNKDKSLYMIFAEQQLFGEIAAKNDINVKTILKEKYIAGKSVYENDLSENGILKERFAEKYLVHLGEFKNQMKNDLNLQNNVCNHIKRLLNE